MKIKIAYLVKKPGRLVNGERTWRYFFQPDAALRAADFEQERLSDDPVAAQARMREITAAIAKFRKTGVKPERSGKALHIRKDSDRQRPQKLPDVPRTMEQLARDYQQTRKYLDLAPNSQKSYQQMLRLILLWAGKKRVVDISRPNILLFLDKLAQVHDAKANYVGRVLRILMQHAVNRGVIAVNPASKPGLGAVKARHHIIEYHVAMMLADTATRMGWHSVKTAIYLGGYLCQRKVDVLQLTWGSYGEQQFLNPVTSEKFTAIGFDFVQQKTGKHIRGQAITVLQEHLATLSPFQHKQTPIVICDTTGKPWSLDHFTKTFTKIRAQAMQDWPQEAQAIELARFSDLRRSGMVWLSRLGVQIKAITDLSGHDLTSAENIIDTYIPSGATGTGAAVIAMNEFTRRRKETQ